MFLSSISNVAGHKADSVKPGRLPPLDLAGKDENLKIAFGVLSSKKSASAINQIAQAVYPHPVYVHHDFSKEPDFSLENENVHILENPASTSWGGWSLVEATFRLMDAAMQDKAVTHFQLLSESCLPARSIPEFEAYLRQEQPDVMMDILPLSQSEDALYSHGGRYLPYPKWMFRIVRRSLYWIWGDDAKFLPSGSIKLRLARNSKSLLESLKAFSGKIVIRMIFMIVGYGKVFRENGIRQQAVGGQWFGASRRVVAWLLKARECCSSLTDHYRQCHIPDESYIHTLLLNARLAGLPMRFYPGNHVLFWDQVSSGPITLGLEHIKKVMQSKKFFARKFSLDITDPARKVVVNALHVPHDSQVVRSL